MSEEEYQKALELLRSLRESLSEEQKTFAKNLADYLLATAQKKDYEGKQYFPHTDYSRRN